MKLFLKKGILDSTRFCQRNFFKLKNLKKVSFTKKRLCHRKKFHFARGNKFPSQETKNLLNQRKTLLSQKCHRKSFLPQAQVFVRKERLLSQKIFDRNLIYKEQYFLHTWISVKKNSKHNRILHFFYRQFI